MTLDEQLDMALYACAPHQSLHPLLEALNAVSSDCGLPHYADGRHSDHLEDVSDRLFATLRVKPYIYYVLVRCRVCGYICVQLKSELEESR